MKIAVIGAGYWGKNLVRNFSELGVLDTVCDTGMDRLKAVRGKYPGVRTTTSLSDVLADDAISGVVVATPAETHYLIAKECISAGKHVFVEKPISLMVDEGRELVDMAAKAGRVLMVGHILEYHPAIMKLKEIIDKGKLGNIYYIYSNRLNLGKIRREENILWSFAPHDISVMLLLLNEMPVSVSAKGGNYLHKDIADVTISNLEFASGVKGHIFVSWLHPYKEQKLIVVGDKAMAVFDDVTEMDKLKIYGHKIEWHDRIPVSKNAKAEIIKIKKAEPLKNECAHFVECIKKRRTPRTDGKSGLNVLKILDACQRSLGSGGASVSLGGRTGSRGYHVHPTATIEEPCEIGDGTKIWHYAHVMPGARIGSNCQLGQGVFVGSKAEIGNGVKIQNNVSVYDRVKIEDDVFCGPSCVFTNVINPRSHVPRKNEFKTTLVKKGATIGANATIVCGLTIGEYAFIGAGAVVTKDVPAHALVYGNPARQKGWMCECGVKHESFGSRSDKCKACGKLIARLR